MKNLTTLFIGLFSACIALAQNEIPFYKQNPDIPLFQLQLVNNSTYSSTALKKNRPTTIMYFSPGCDHCIKQFENMVKNMQQFKDIQIVMATYQPMEELIDFYQKNKLEKYANIIIGRDLNYFLPPYYKMANLPYFAFYNKSGKFTAVHEGNISIEKMLKNLQQ